MDEWIRQTLSAGQHGLAVLPAAFVLGLLGSVSSCCTLPVLAAVGGYAGSVGSDDDRLTAGLVGIGFGLERLGAVAGKVMPVVRMGVGVLLVGLGFYLLAPA